MEVVSAFVRNVRRKFAPTILPELYVSINGPAPGLETFRFKQRGRLFVAERDDGVVRYFCEGHDDRTGFGRVTLRMQDGTERELRQHVACSAGFVNRAFPNLRVVDVVVGDYEEREPSRKWHYDYALTVAYAQEILATYAPRWTLEQVDVAGLPTWNVKRRGRRAVQSPLDRNP